MARSSVVSWLPVVLCLGGCGRGGSSGKSHPTPTQAVVPEPEAVVPEPEALPAPVATASTAGPPTITVRAHVESMDNDPREVFEDASMGFPAMSRDGAKVAVLEAEQDLAEELDLSLEIFPASGGKALERIVLVSMKETGLGHAHPGRLLPIVEGRARAVNKRLLDGGYAPLPRVEGDVGKATLRIDDLAVTLAGGRLRVTNALGRVRLDFDAREWQRPPAVDFVCVTHPAIKWAAYDRARGVLVVEITHAIEVGGDSCPTPSLFRVFSLDAPP